MHSDKACFINKYSMINEQEDRAELFEYLMNLDSKSQLSKCLESVNIKNKIILMDKVLMDYFDSIDENNCFEWQYLLHTM